MIDSDRIAADRAIIEAATPGPWEAQIYAPATYRNSVFVSNTGEIVAHVTVDDNATFIAAARTGWPAALDEVERLWAEIDRLNGLVGCGCDICLAHNNMRCPKMGEAQEGTSDEN